MDRRDYIFVASAILAVVMVGVGLWGLTSYRVNPRIASIVFLVGMMLFLIVGFRYSPTNTIRKERRLLSMHVYGIIVCAPLVIIPSAHMNDLRKALLVSVIGILPGVLGAIIWCRYIKRNMTDGLLATRGGSPKAWIILFIATIAYTYALHATPYREEINLGTMIACFAFSIYSAIEIVLLERRIGQKARYSSSSKGSIWGVLYVTATAIAIILISS